MSDTLLTVLLAGGGAGLLAAWLLSAEASQRDLVQRVEHAVRADVAVGTRMPAASPGGLLLGLLQRMGQGLRESAFFSEAAAADLERAATGAGFDPRKAVPVAIAGKVLLIPLCPTLAYAGATLAGYSGMPRLLLAMIAFIAGMLGPNWSLAWARRRRQANLRRGLPDALDLLVVCTEAGLGLESAVDRVATEMRGSNPAIAGEFELLGQELRMASDRATALARFGERAQLDTWQRLTATLSQTMRYGTPLGQALRTLAAEMRNGRLLRLEERAAKLPALLTLPMILFILPCLFIVLAGPAAIRILKIMSH